MKKTTLFFVYISFFASAFICSAQGTFENLDFEMADPGLGTFVNNVPIASALPFWSVSYGNNPQSEVNFNDSSTGATAVGLIGGQDFKIDGNYSVLLQGTTSDATISQTGTIPANAQTLFFEANGYAPMSLVIGGQIVSYSAFSTAPNYTLYEANISSWAGRTEPLVFSASAGGPPGGIIIDDISFSPSAVTPEPDVFTLMSIGGTLFAAYRRSASKWKNFICEM